MDEKIQNEDSGNDKCQIPDCTVSDKDSFENLEEMPKKELVGMVKSMTLTMEEYFSGPLPHPDILRDYEKILPGSADRILKMAEAQSEHRQNLEKTVLATNSRDSLLGIIAAFILGVIGLAGGIYAVLKGAVAAGTFVTTLSLSSLVGTFVYGTRSERKERQEKDKNNK